MKPLTFTLGLAMPEWAFASFAIVGSLIACAVVIGLVVLVARAIDREQGRRRMEEEREKQSREEWFRTGGVR